MKKILIIAGALCLLSSFPANAQVIFEFPQGKNDWRRNSEDRYWRQVYLNQQAEERARHIAHERELERQMERERIAEYARHHNNGKHYAYGKKHPKRHGKGYEKNHPQYHD